jgi:hypothetical protein
MKLEWLKREIAELKFDLVDMHKQVQQLSKASVTKQHVASEILVGATHHLHVAIQRLQQVEEL